MGETFDMGHVPVGVQLVVTSKEPIASLRFTSCQGHHDIAVATPITDTLMIDGHLGKLRCTEPVADVVGSIGQVTITRSGRLTLAPVASENIDQSIRRLTVFSGGHLTGGRGRCGPVFVGNGARLSGELPDLIIEGSAIGRVDVTAVESLDTLNFRIGSPKAHHARARITADPSGGSIYLGAVQGEGYQPLLELEDVSELRASSIRVDFSRLVVRSVEGKCRTRLVLPPGSVATDIQPDIDISAGPGTLLRVYGCLRAIDCRHVTVTPSGDRDLLELLSDGDSPGYAILAIEGDLSERHFDPFEGAVIRGVRVTDDAAGRRVLQQLSGAAVVEPVPVFRIGEFGFRWRPGRLNNRWRPYPRRRTVYFPESFGGRRLYWEPLFTRRPGWDWTAVNVDNRREVEDAAVFAQEIAALAEARSSSGSIRTRAAWAAFRGRQLTTTSRAERVALALFRLVGYGQRPGPAFATWFVAAVTLAAPMAILAQSGPINHYSGALTNMLFAPASLLRLVGDPSLSDSDWRGDLQILLRTMVAAPFLFATFAASRFLRADWPWSR